MEDWKMSLAQRKVLVLNKSWQAIGIVSLEKALKKVAGVYKDGTPKAKIIDCVNDFKLMTWEDWTELRPHPKYCHECEKICDQAVGDKCGVCDKMLGEEGMRGVSVVLRIPTVIQYTRYDKLPAQKVHYNRRTIYKRDKNTCQYCGKRKISSELSIDHVVPKCQGGPTTWENVVCACIDCNSKKAGRTPQEANMKLLSKPVKPQYNFFFGEKIVKSWKSFVSEAYWSVELENDNDKPH
jgi:5-methylcytosine-specific restriction endonuclease McrA